MKKYVNYAGIVGLASLFVGLVIYSINAAMTTLVYVALIAGGVCLIGYIALKFNEIKAGLSSRSAKYGSNAALMIIIVLGIIIVVNIFGNRFSYRQDYTAAKQFSLAEQTQKVLKNLAREVKVTGFFKSGDEARAEELVKEYVHFSSKLSYEFVDPDKKPGIAKSYTLSAYNVMFIESGGKREKIERIEEEPITNALIKVTREGQKKIYFTTGHGEKSTDESERTGLSTAREAIMDENYLIEKITLVETDSIPDDCSALVVCGPRTDLFDKEKEMINTFLKNGGKALLMLDPGTPDSYVELVKEWGFDVGKNIVVDASGIGQLFGAGPTIPLVSQYTQHQLTEDFNVMTFFPEARSISKNENTPTGLSFTEIAKTAPRSWGETSPLTQGQIAFDEGEDLGGPITIFAVAEQNAQNPSFKRNDKYGLATEPLKTRLAVFGDSDFASNSYFKVQGNGNLFLNTISWLAGEEDLISVRPKDPEDRRLTLTKTQSRFILWFGVILLPILIFVAGIFVYVGRK